jgi:hypothetical protein
MRRSAQAARMGQSDSGGLGSRLYDYLKRTGTTVDSGEHADLDELTEQLGTTADELQPVIDSGLAEKRLAGIWRKGFKFYSLTTPSYLASRAEATVRADAAIDEWFGDEPGAKKTAKPATRKPGKPVPQAKPPDAWSYAQVPRAIFRDPDLSPTARLAACALADAWNVNAKQNPARIIKASLDTLAGKMGADSKATAASAVDELERLGWVKIERGKGHGSNRYRFTSKVRG